MSVQLYDADAFIHVVVDGVVCPINKMEFNIATSGGDIYIFNRQSYYDPPFIVRPLADFTNPTAASASLLIDKINLIIAPKDDIHRVEVAKNSAAVTGTQQQVNFIEGTNITMTVAEDASQKRTNVTINASGGGAAISDGDRGDITLSGGGYFYMIDQDVLSSGTYTPTLTNSSNITASTAYQCQWSRVRTTVTVSGKVDIDPTAPAASTILGISLPVASNFASAEDCGGVAFASGIAGMGAAVLADAANNRATMQWVSGDITNQSLYFTFSYEVI